MTKLNTSDAARALRGYDYNARLARAVESLANKHSTQRKGSLALAGTVKWKALAASNPLHRQAELYLCTLDYPNGNRQAIPASEAQNILESAINSAVKVNIKTLSHDGATACGTITSAEQRDNNIYAVASLWRENPAVDELIQEPQLYTSFEVYYAESEVKNGIEYLRNCNLSAICFVDTPAYGTLAASRIL